MALTDNERAINDINVDLNAAKDYANTFLNRTNTELYARALKLNSAMNQLVQFMALPPSAQPPSIWGAAFGALMGFYPSLQC